MKKQTKQFALILSTLFSLVILGSCAPDIDPDNSEIFMGKYEGSIAFTPAGSSTPSKSNQSNGSVRVTRLGDNYTFTFSDGIPTLENIKYAQGDDNTYVNIDLGGEAGVIKVTKSKLQILYKNQKGTWNATCNRSKFLSAKEGDEKNASTEK